MTERDSSRDRYYRIVFVLGAAYNLAFGIWAAAWPFSFFDTFGIPRTNQPAIWQCLGMVIGVYGAGYAWSALRPEAAKPIIAMGLAGKILGPIGWIAIVGSGDWPLRTFTMILFNDLVWWLPFSLFLLEGTRVGAWIRRQAAPACAILNAAAAAAMLFVLRQGMEVVPDDAERARYISTHAAAWRVGWAIWIAAAFSLAAFYAWWGSRLGRPRVAIAAFLLVVAGVACDVFAESLYIGWLPERLSTAGPLGTLMTGGAANALYTIAGILLTIATPLGRAMRVSAVALWLFGACVTPFTILGWWPGLAAATAGLMTLLPVWVWALGRKLNRRNLESVEERTP